MILTCPSCATRYYADDASIGAAGRSVRCAACTHTWFVEPQLVLGEDAPVVLRGREEERPLNREQVERMRRAAGGHAPSAPLSSAAKYRAMQAERQRKERVKAAALAWTVTGVALAATTTSAVAFREDVARIWPKTASAYAAVGLDVNIFGLEFVDLQVEHVFDGPEPVLVVRGAVTNIGRDDRPAPVLRFGLRDSTSTEIQHVLARMVSPNIPAGGAAPFEIRIENASPDAQDLEATFASFGEAESAPRSAAFAPPAPVLDPPAVEGALTLDTLAPSEGASASHDGLAPRLREPFAEDHG
ncbi:MAG: zinc-ribbon domain-containing protein [Hyphomonadaceae bacterium]|nr:zinc-ribbon domain-containing protein [Hyphomonadaceae bacterium]